MKRPRKIVTIVYRHDGVETGRDTVERAIYTHKTRGEYILIQGMDRYLEKDNIVYFDCNTIHLTPYQTSFQQVIDSVLGKTPTEIEESAKEYNKKIGDEWK